MPAYRPQSLHSGGADAVDRHHDQPGEQDRAEVGEEQEQRPECLLGRAGLERQPDDRERRDQRDRDCDARQRVGHVVANEREGPDGAGRQCGDEIPQGRVDAAGYLRVRRSDNRHRRQLAQQPPEGDHGTRSGCDEQQRDRQIPWIHRNRREDHAENRGHQRRDDHRPDHRRRRVSDDPGRRDHSGEQQQRPESAQLASALRTIEQERVAHPGQVSASDRGHQAPAGGTVQLRASERAHSCAGAAPDLCPGRLVIGRRAAAIRACADRRHSTRRSGQFHSDPPPARTGHLSDCWSSTLVALRACGARGRSGAGSSGDRAREELVELGVEPMDEGQCPRQLAGASRGWRGNGRAWRGSWIRSAARAGSSASSRTLAILSAAKTARVPGSACATRSRSSRLRVV